MFSRSPDLKIAFLTSLIPALNKIPHRDRLEVFKQVFHSKWYLIFLGIILICFILLFYFNLDLILDYNALKRGGMISRNLHFLKELGTTFFLPLMMVMLSLVWGRNYFVKKEIEKYLRDNKNV